jgi:hypothetical protein
MVDVSIISEMKWMREITWYVLKKSVWEMTTPVWMVALVNGYQGW